MEPKHDQSVEIYEKSPDMNLVIPYDMNLEFNTFVEQVRSQGADPYAYFEWVFEKLMHQKSQSAEQIDELLPTAWLQARDQSKIA